MGLMVGSLFAGVEGFGMGFERAGFKVAWQVEIDRDAVSVLERHYPNVLRVRDVRKATALPNFDEMGSASADSPEVIVAGGLPPVDVITGGFPCQDLSVAGKGAGLSGSRSGLFFQIIRLVEEMRAATDGRYPVFLVLENVPGLLSSHEGEDFTTVLAALAQSGALDIAWRVLDAQWFGIPQRRRRIFLVCDFRGERAAQVLFESEGSDRDSEACRPPWEGAAGGAEDGAEVAFTLRANRNGTGSSDNAWNTTYIPAVSGPLTAGMDSCQHNGQDDHADLLVTSTTGPIAAGDTGRYGKGSDSDVTDTLLIADTVRSHPRPGSNSVGNVVMAACDVADTLSVGANQTTGFVGDDVAHAITASAGHHGHSSPRGDGSSNLIPVSFSVRHAERDLSSVAACLQAGTGKTGNMLPAVLQFQQPDTDALPELAAGTGGPGSQDWQQHAAVLHGIDWQQVGDTVEDGTACLSTKRTPAVGGRPGMAVRRLTPRECERLMSWPDDWTRWRGDGSEISDGPRYRMIGNGVVSNVAEWIARRLRAALEAS